MGDNENSHDTFIEQTVRSKRKKFMMNTPNPCETAFLKPTHKLKMKQNVLRGSKKKILEDKRQIRCYRRQLFNKNKKEQMNEPEVKKYERGLPINRQMVKPSLEKTKLKQKEKKIDFALKQSVQSELLLTEQPGFLELEKGEKVSDITQVEIQNAVDPTNACKRFDLILNDFGPYRINYTRNGRFLLLGGKRGHVAAMDWISKKLMCEINVMESVHDVAWLHQETMYSVAQKKWVYFYDNQGIELHCVKQLNDVVRLMFLPYHFLLSSVSSAGIISWLDVTMGKIVQQFHIPAHYNPSTVAQHPANALICLGQSTGVVSFWSPNHHKPCISKWCHKQPLCAIGFDPKGQIFVTASMDRTVKLWDARSLDGPLTMYTLRSPPNWISLSQTGLTSFGMGNVIEIYKDFPVEGKLQKKLYLRHLANGCVKNMEFCPYEDVLGIGHTKGFSSILVPGSGEANFDALEVNPFQSKSQRKETEVKQLLSKIPSELITWDPNVLRKVHIPSLEDIIEQKKKIAFIKPPNIVIEPRYKSGKKSGSANASKRKKIMKEELRKKHIQNMKAVIENDEFSSHQKKKQTRKRKKQSVTSVLDRFKSKPKN